MLANVGNELDRYGIRLLQLRRPYDSMTWPHAQRGYFKLKEQIPALLERLEISGAADEIESEAV
jgi:deoxyribodipyrimidine photo-lyase